MKVRTIEHVYPHLPGAVVEFPEDKAMVLINSGHATAIPEEVETEVAPKAKKGRKGDEA